MRRLMKLAFAAPALVLLLGAAPAPSGTFTISTAPFSEGGTVSFTFSQLSHVKPNFEVTLGVWCTQPSGAEIPWGNQQNPYVYEFNSFGKQLSGNSISLALPAEGTGYMCEALFFAVDWDHGAPVQSWGLDYHMFQVAA